MTGCALHPGSCPVVGFYVGALEGAGARNVVLHFERPAPDGARAGTPVERIRFAVQWTDAGVDGG
jgi:hypothetical protein